MRSREARPVARVAAASCGSRDVQLFARVELSPRLARRVAVTRCSRAKPAVSREVPALSFGSRDGATVPRVEFRPRMARGVAGARCGRGKRTLSRGLPRRRVVPATVRHSRACSSRRVYRAASPQLRAVAGDPVCRGRFPRRRTVCARVRGSRDCVRFARRGDVPATVRRCRTWSSGRVCRGVSREPGAVAGSAPCRAGCCGVVWFPRRSAVRARGAPTAPSASRRRNSVQSREACGVAGGSRAVVRFARRCAVRAARRRSGDAHPFARV